MADLLAHFAFPNRQTAICWRIFRPVLQTAICEMLANVGGFIRRPLSIYHLQQQRKRTYL